MLTSTKNAIRWSRDIALAKLSLHRRSYRNHSITVLTYHRVLSANYPDIATAEPGMVVMDRTFDMHMQLLSRELQVLPLANWIDRVAEGKDIPAHAAAVTFDDGWADNYHYAFPILKKYTVPATIFLVSDFVGTRMQFWPERLMRALRHIAATRAGSKINGDGSMGAWFAEITKGISPVDCTYDREDFAIIVERAKRWSDDQNHNFLDQLAITVRFDESQQAPDLLDWAQVKEMSGSGLVDFGSHTRRHVRLGDSTDSDTLHDEVVESRRIIAAGVGADARLFCYPNGDRSAMADQLVQQNYVGGCTTQQGWNDAATDPFEIKRITMHDGNSSSPHEFLARLSGL